MPNNDPLGFFEEIAPYGEPYEKVVANANRDPDRYRDYRDVLIDGEASPEKCKRVLWDLFQQMGLFHTPLRADENLLDSHKMFARLGKQELGRWLLATLMDQPEARPEQPEKTQSKE